MFEQKNIKPDRIIDAGKQKIDRDRAWELISGVETIYVGKRKKVLSFEPVNENKEEILKNCLGRTGNLRAPTLIAQHAVFVGFNDSIYDNE